MDELNKADTRVLDELIEEKRKRHNVGCRVLELLKPCLGRDHKYQKIDGDEIEEFMGSVIKETEWCKICGSLRYTSQRHMDGRFFDFRVIKTVESEHLNIVKKISSGA